MTPLEGLDWLMRRMARLEAELSAAQATAVLERQRADEVIELVRLLRDEMQEAGTWPSSDWRHDEVRSAI